MVQILAGVAALLMAASLPIAAQVTPERPGIPGNPVSPLRLGDTSAIAKEARGWLADAIKINTSNPPGNEQIAAMYITGIPATEGVKTQTRARMAGRSAGGAGLRSSAGGQARRGPKCV